MESANMNEMHSMDYDQWIRGPKADASGLRGGLTNQHSQLYDLWVPELQRCLHGKVGDTLAFTVPKDLNAGGQMIAILVTMVIKIGKPVTVAVHGKYPKASHLMLFDIYQQLFHEQFTYEWLREWTKSEGRTKHNKAVLNFSIRSPLEHVDSKSLENVLSEYSTKILRKQMGVQAILRLVWSLSHIMEAYTPHSSTSSLTIVMTFVQTVFLPNMERIFTACDNGEIHDAIAIPYQGDDGIVWIYANQVFATGKPSPLLPIQIKVIHSSKCCKYTLCVLAKTSDRFALYRFIRFSENGQSAVGTYDLLVNDQ
jgi:hypothetical protein